VYALDEEGVDVIITEIGGTVGDIESQPYLEAIRQIARDKGRDNCVFIHVSLIVKIPGSDEQKSKPTQHSVKELLSVGIQPDIIVARSDDPVTQDVRNKIALFCNVTPDCVIQNTTAKSLYEVPLRLAAEGLDKVVCRKLGFEETEADLTEWTRIVDRALHPSKSVEIALVGKYTELHDAYLSIVEAFRHAGIENDADVIIRWVESDKLTDENIEEKLGGVSGVLVPGGFGDRGIEGKIRAVRWARETKTPFFGICLGMQMAVIEFARNVCGLKDANSTEMNDRTPYPVIDLMPDQIAIKKKGGTMRLGKYPCDIVHKDSKAFEAYGTNDISERHRHRYEFNNEYRDIMQDKGLRLTGLSPNRRLVEIVELADHPWFVGVQFHPCLKSRPNRAHPLFREFVKAALKVKKA